MANGCNGSRLCENANIDYIEVVDVSMAGV